MPKVTIGIPSYNAQSFLKYAIQSILHQDFQDWELIIVDDGSTDASLDIAKSFRDRRITVITNPTNMGIGQTVNRTVELAKGEYYCRMDSDDIMVADRISTQLKFLEKNLKYSVVGGMAYVIDGSNKIKGLRSGNPFTTQGVHSILKNGPPLNPTVMGRTEWFKENPYDTSLKRSEDIELWLRTADNHNFFSIPKPLIFYREMGNQNKKVALASREYRKLLKRNISSSPHRKAFLKEIAKSHIKSRLRYLASMIGAEKQILSRRNLIMSHQQMANAEHVLKRTIGQDLHTASNDDH